MISESLNIDQTAILQARCKRILRYSTFNILSTKYSFLCLGFTSHIMSKNWPSIFDRIYLYFGISALKYFSGISKIITSITLCLLMMSISNKASS